MINGIDMSGFASAIRELRTVQKAGNSPLQDAALESARKSKSAAVVPGDMLLLSPSAKQLTDFFATQETADGENGDVDLEGMKLRSDMLAEALQMQLGAFQNKMVGILGSAGLDANTPFTMQADSAGAIRVTNGHSDATGIESLMKNMPGLSKEFNEISGLASVVRANNFSRQGGKMASLNPLSIAAQYAKNTGARSGERFNLRLAANEANYFFN